MKHKITSFHLAELITILSQVEHLRLENKTWTVEVGKTIYDSSDFTPRAQVYVNGEDVGWIALDQVQDMLTKGE
jgi:hypothetical protein